MPAKEWMTVMWPVVLVVGGIGIGALREIHATPASPQSMWLVYPHECLDSVELSRKSELWVPRDEKGKLHPEGAINTGLVLTYDPNCKTAENRVTPETSTPWEKRDGKD